MKQILGPVSFALPEQSFAGRVGVLGLFECTAVDGSGLVSCHFSPTHSPNPSLAPPGERGELHVAAFFKVGTLGLNVRWPQSEGKPATSRCSQISRRSNWPALDFSGNRPQGAHEDQALPQRQLASNCLQPIERRLNQLPTQFDGNAPLRAFFPPLKTRPHVAVGSLSAPKGVERVGVRGGIQRLRNKNAADNRRSNSSEAFLCIQKILQKQEQTMHIERGLELKKTQIISQDPQIAIQELAA